MSQSGITLTQDQQNALELLQDEDGARIVGVHLGMPVYQSRSGNLYALPPKRPPLIRGRRAKYKLRVVTLSRAERAIALARQAVVFRNA